MRVSIIPAVLLSMLAVSAGQAQVTYTSGGFELPRFVIQSSLEGQDITNPWQKSAGTSTAVVQTNQTADPLPQFQSVLVTRAAQSSGDTQWWVAAPATPAGGSIVNVDFDLNVNVAPVLTYGPLFGVEAYDTTGGTRRTIGSVFLDAAQGRLLMGETGSGALTSTDRFYSRNAYHHLTLSLDFGSDQYTVLVDGQAVQTRSFVDAGIAGFSYAAITTLASDSDTQTGQAYFDNYVVSQAPEPGIAAIIALGMPAALARRRRPRDGSHGC